ncbi:MAG: hypothetical protein KBF21_16200 [Thermoanaerobaculia bacterium]|nr:hypothetical protein [Thermoanaerobaculia bacterium]MBP9825769.1 hypothetical protein [Thermoanaerobaculia bacterium]
MKKLLSWILGGIGLAVPPATAGGRTVTVYPPNVEGLTALRLEIRIDGAVAGLLAADKSAAEVEPSVTIPLATGFHAYALAGEALFADGRSEPVRGEGIVARDEFVRERLEGRAAKADPVGALESLLAELRALPGAPALPRLERGPRGPFESALAAAEARFDLVLPPTCATLLRRFGPFLYVSRGDGGEEPRAALSAPESFLTVPEWRRQVRRAALEAGDTPVARERMAQLERDVVIGHSFDTVWTLRAGSHPPCPNGSASLAGEFLYENDPAEDIWVEGTDTHAGYFGDREPRCGDRTELLHDNLTAAFVSGFADAAALSRDGALRLRLDSDRSTPGGLAFTIGD